MRPCRRPPSHGSAGVLQIPVHRGKVDLSYASMQYRLNSRNASIPYFVRDTWQGFAIILINSFPRIIKWIYPFYKSTF